MENTIFNPEENTVSDSFDPQKSLMKSNSKCALALEVWFKLDLCFITFESRCRAQVEFKKDFSDKLIGYKLASLSIGFFIKID